MCKCYSIILLSIIIIYSFLVQYANGKTSLETFVHDNIKNIHNYYNSIPNEGKKGNDEYEQIEYFYDLWIDTYFRKKNFEITCDNIMNYLAMKKNKTIFNNQNTDYVRNQDFKYKKTYDVCHYFEKNVRSTPIPRFNETIFDRDIYDSTAEYLYYVWIALSNPPFNLLINHDFLDDFKCPIQDLFLTSLIPYSLLFTFSLIFLLVRRHYNRALNQLRKKIQHQHLSQNQLNQLKLKTLTKKDIEILNSDCSNGFHELCGICREIYQQNEKVRILYCKHFFHKECIDNWLLYYNSICPYCKSDISLK